MVTRADHCLDCPAALSRPSMRYIRQHLFWPFAYNLPGIPVAAGVLDPFFGLMLRPISAVATVSCSALS